MKVKTFLLGEIISKFSFNFSFACKFIKLNFWAAEVPNDSNDSKAPNERWKGRLEEVVTIIYQFKSVGGI